MEEFVRRLFGDVEFRHQFLANPSAVVGNSGLSRNDREAVMRLSGNLEAALTKPRTGLPSTDALQWQ